MKKFIFVLIAIAASSISFAGPVLTKTYNLNSTTPADVINLNGTGINYHNLRWNTPATVTTCTIKIQKSTNGVTSWTDLISAQSCTSSGSASITTGAANFIRVSLATYGGSGTVVAWYGGYIDLASSVTTATAKAFVYSDALNTVVSTSAPTDGQLLIGSTGNIPVVANLTAGAGISITNGAGSISVASTAPTLINSWTYSGDVGSVTFQNISARNLIVSAEGITKSTASYPLVKGSKDNCSTYASVTEIDSNGNESTYDLTMHNTGTTAARSGLAQILNFGASGVQKFTAAGGETHSMPGRISETGALNCIQVYPSGGGNFTGGAIKLYSF